MMEGSQKNGPSGGDWVSEGGSRAEEATTHEYHGDEVGPAWLTRRKGDKVETLSEHHGVAQVYVRARCRW